ncbi:LuxR C-terminal-related transcriptional regulator [Kribbella sp. NPDC023855]|uniref:response regulator transcription factor n=1 Tax=Kribbella sp. NPDC023855 TaxID=3154698 RepID=UPI0033F37CDA
MHEPHGKRCAALRHQQLERIGRLTPRETELLLSVARGLTNAEISAEYHISLSTTKTHVGNLLTKLAARDRVQLIIRAYEAGLMR